jgi:hypothetical protein
MRIVFPFAACRKTTKQFLCYRRNITTAMDLVGEGRAIFNGLAIVLVPRGGAHRSGRVQAAGPTVRVDPHSCGYRK